MRCQYVCSKPLSLVLSSKTNVKFRTLFMHVHGVLVLSLKCVSFGLLSVSVIHFTRARTPFSFSLAFSTLCASHRFHAGMHVHSSFTESCLLKSLCQLQTSRGHTHSSYSRPSLSVSYRRQRHAHSSYSRPSQSVSVSVTDFTRVRTL